MSIRYGFIFKLTVALSVTYFAYSYQDDLKFTVEYLLSDDSHRLNLDKYFHFKNAIIELQKSYSKLPQLKQDFSNILTLDEIPIYEEVIAELSSDIDYLLAELDQMRGGDSLKQKRKEIASKLTVLSRNVDIWIEIVKRNKEKLLSLHNID
jgi:hypothetical protein